MKETTKQPTGIGLKFLLSVAAIIVILAGLKASQSLSAPFLLAIFFAMVLMPPLRWLKQKGLSDGIAILTLSVLVFLVGFGIVSILSSSLTSFAKHIPTYQAKLGSTLQYMDGQIGGVIEQFNRMEQSIKKVVPSFAPPEETETPEAGDGRPEAEDGRPEAEGGRPEAEDGRPEAEGGRPEAGEGRPEAGGERPEAGDGRQETGNRGTKEMETLQNGSEQPSENFSLRNVIQLNTIMSYVQSGVRDMLNIATISFLVAVIVIFILAEAAQMPAKVREAFEGRDLSNEYFDRIAEDTWKYTKIKTIISLLTGLATWIGLWFIGVEYALLWGLLMFFLNYLPNIGPIIASVPPVLLALVDQGPGACVVVIIWMIFVNFLFGYGFEPRWLGAGLGLSDLVVLLSLIFWGWILGPIGMFLSAPLTMVVKIVLQNDKKTRWIAVLLSNNNR